MGLIVGVNTGFINEFCNSERRAEGTMTLRKDEGFVNCGGCCLDKDDETQSRKQDKEAFW